MTAELLDDLAQTFRVFFDDLPRLLLDLRRLCRTPFSSCGATPRLLPITAALSARNALLDLRQAPLSLENRIS
jgi:hypothetical protein